MPSAIPKRIVLKKHLLTNPTILTTPSSATENMLFVFREICPLLEKKNKSQTLNLLSLMEGLFLE